MLLTSLTECNSNYLNSRVSAFLHVFLSHLHLTIFFNFSNYYNLFYKPISNLANQPLNFNLRVYPMTSYNPGYNNTDTFFCVRIPALLIRVFNISFKLTKCIILFCLCTCTMPLLYWSWMVRYSQIVIFALSGIFA